jgi:hypothetical protein
LDAIPDIKTLPLVGQYLPFDWSFTTHFVDATKLQSKDGYMDIYAH